jgi:hypothetical protein
VERKAVAEVEAKRERKAVAVARAEAKRARRAVAVAKVEAKNAHLVTPKADANLPDKPRNKVKLYNLIYSR